MAWIAGYHNRIEEHHDQLRPTWAEARDVMVVELDQRVMGLESNPGDYPELDADELDELREARDYFASLDEGEEGAADASGWTFVLAPDAVLPTRDVVDLLISGQIVVRV